MVNRLIHILILKNQKLQIGIYQNEEKAQSNNF